MDQHYIEFLSSTGYRKANSAASQAKRLTAIRAVFISIRGHRLTQQTVATIVSNCRANTRLGGRKVTPHTLRHTFATTLLANGENLQTIRVLMNHKNISTTARYLHARDEQLNVAVNSISLSDD